ncbi:MAG TPA: AAC(3) family N-acetyltransferase [Aliidongia sp.]|nr:AAC(3) family N-acetyltransferase [Aliidongia sp.]
MRSIWERFAVPRQGLSAELAALFSPLPPGTPILVHSDLLRIGIPDGLTEPEAQCEAWIALLMEAAGNRPVLLPTFNYDFPRTRLFDPARDPGQIGALSRHCVEHHAALRTRTPIFNFCVFGNDDLPLAAEAEPFGPESLFATLHERNAAILFLGADMIANTFIHYVEERLDIGYRYVKPFPGEIIEDGERRPIDFRYRVRPRIDGAVAYGDLGRPLLQEAGKLQIAAIGHGTAMMFRARDYVDLIGGRMQDDELYVLTPSSRAVIEELYRRHGRPLTLGKME